MAKNRSKEDTYYDIFDDSDDDLNEEKEEIVIKGKKIKSTDKIMKIPKKKNLKD